VHVCAGKGLCMLKKEDCRHRAPRDGDVIYSIFTMLMNSVPDGQLTYLLTYLLLPLTRYSRQIVLATSEIPAQF